MSDVDINKRLASIREFGTTLMITTARSLPVGKEADIVSWQHIADECEAFIEQFALARDPNINEADIPSEITILKQLATVVLSTNLAHAREVANQIPNDPHFELPYKLGQAIVDMTAINRLDQDQASSLSDLAFHLFDLVSYAQDLKEFKKALIYVFNVSQEVIELCIKKGDMTTAIYQAPLFVNIATLLFTKCGLTEYLENALSRSEQIMHNDPPSANEIQIALCALSHNMVNAYLRLAQKMFSDARLYFERGLKIALHGRNAARVLHGKVGNSNTNLMVIEACFSDVCVVQANLARSAPEQFNIYADDAWKSLQEYINLANQYPDPDLEYRANKLQQTIYLSLREARPNWIPPDEYQDITQMEGFFNEREFESLLGENRLLQEEIHLLMDQINLLTDASEQQKVVTDTLEDWYLKLEYSLMKIIAEIGLNHHVCRLLVALGAIASGRFNTIAPKAISAWIYKIEKDHNLVGERRSIWQRQHMIPAKHFEEEKKVFLSIVKLATLASSLHQVPVLTSFLQSSLRKHNAALLEKVLPKVTYTQHDDSRKQTKANDLKLLLQKFPQDIALTTLIIYYQLALKIDQSSWSQNGPLSPSNLSWEKALDFVMALQNQEQKARDQENSSESASEEEHVQEFTNTDYEQQMLILPRGLIGRQENPDDNIQYSFVFVTNFEENPVREPEDLIGAELRDPKNPQTIYRVVEILGQGSEGVVFSIRSSDGDGGAIKLFHDFFDLRSNLHKKINRLLESDQATPENMLPVLNQIVQYFPDDAIGWFNRGVFIEETDLAEALNCYNHAIELEPHDASNYLKKGHVLLKMHCHQQAAEAIRLSFEANKDGVRNYFVAVYINLLEMIDIFKQTTELSSEAQLALEDLIDIQFSIKQEAYTRIAYICDTVALAMIVHQNDLQQLKNIADQIANMDNQDRVIQGTSSLMQMLENLLRSESSQVAIDQLPEDLSRKYTEILEQISVPPNTLEHLLVEVRLHVRRAIFGNDVTEHHNVRRWLSEVEQNNAELMQEEPDLQKFFHLLYLWLQGINTNDQELELSDHYHNLLMAWKTP